MAAIALIRPGEHVQAEQQPKKSQPSRELANVDGPT